MNQSVIYLYKPQGMTPLESLERLRESIPDMKDKTLGYAGRLDPMAEGVLVVLIDEANKQRSSYERLPKKYEFELLLGISTDTYDGLGIVTSISDLNKCLGNGSSSWRMEVDNVIKNYVGTWDQPYPPYSSARVNGKPLFYWARKGLLDTIVRPSKQVTIDSIEIISKKIVILGDIIPSILKRIDKVSGDFRQEEISKTWSELLRTHQNHLLGLVKIHVSCSSGLYIRSLCSEIGQSMSIGGCAYSIKRTAVADMSLETALRI